MYVCMYVCNSLWPRGFGNILGTWEYSEVERVEMDVVACLSGGNLASVELGAVTIGYF